MSALPLPAHSMSPAPDGQSYFELVISRLNHALGVVGAGILVSMLLLISANVLMRYVFNSPIPWADQMATYGLVYVTFIGAPRVLARRGHVAVDILHASLPARQQRLLRVAIDVVGMVYCLLFLLLASKELSGLVVRGAEFSDAVTVPQWIVYAVIPVGAGLLCLQFLANFLADLRILRNAGPALQQ